LNPPYIGRKGIIAAAFFHKKIENPISRLVLEGSFGPDDVIEVGYANGEFTFGKMAG